MFEILKSAASWEEAKPFLRAQLEPIPTPQAIAHGTLKADGITLVTYRPYAPNADSNGLVYDTVIAAAMRYTGKRPGNMRLITGGINFAYELVGNDKAGLLGVLGRTDLILAAPEGSNFKGWKGTRQYKYTMSEISAAIKSKVFSVHDFGLDSLGKP